MLSYEFMIVHDWELNEAEFVHIDLKLCHPNIPNAQRVATCSDKVLRFPFTWQVYYIPSTGQQGMRDSEMLKVSHFPSSQPSLSFITILSLAHRYYQHTGLVSRAWTWFPNTLSVVFSWNFHAAQNTSHSPEQRRHQKCGFWRCTWKCGRQKIKAEFFVLATSYSLACQTVLPATIGFYTELFTHILQLNHVLSLYTV